MNLSQDDYRRYASKTAKQSPIAADCVHAFVVGGTICVIAEALTELYEFLGAKSDDAGTVASVTLIFLSAIITGIGIFDDIARFAGAGTLVPITGFANAVVSPAIDTKDEGWVPGVGTKIFSVAGPVILYGILFGTAYGVIYYIVTLV